MLVKFFHRGTADSNSALSYLLSEAPLKYLAGARDRRGVIRNPAPAVVKGHPELTRRLINQCRNKHHYVSGVVSCERTISKADEDAIIKKFEAVAFAGLREHQYDCLWIRHSHLKRTELHFLAPRTELTSLKALNINPPRAQNETVFDAFRKIINHDFNLKDPSGLQLSAAERARLESKLNQLVEARATYNRNRYPVPEPERILSPILYEDRTGSPGRSAATAQPALPAAGSAARPALERLGGASRALGQTCGQLECLRVEGVGASDALTGTAVDRLGRAARTIGEAGQRLDRASRELDRTTQAVAGRLVEMVALRKRSLVSSGMFTRYNIPERQPAALHENERDVPELERNLDKEL